MSASFRLNPAKQVWKAFQPRLSSQDGRLRKAINGQPAVPRNPLPELSNSASRHGDFRRSSRECASRRTSKLEDCKASGSKALGQRASRSKASRSKLEDFPFRVPDNVRFADLDPNDHVNNAVYFETGRVTLMKEGLAWIMVRPDMHFRAQLRWPGQIEMGSGLVKFGRTSVMFDQVVFSAGKCFVSAQSVSVMIDEVTHKPTPLTAEIVRNFQPWLRRGMNMAQPAL
jgi:acyl-CoA thioester hydrolase